jgi:hypothetical protein
MPLINTKLGRPAKIKGVEGILAIGDYGLMKRGQ